MLFLQFQLGVSFRKSKQNFSKGSTFKNPKQKCYQTSDPSTSHISIHAGPKNSKIKTLKSIIQFFTLHWKILTCVTAHASHFSFRKLLSSLFEVFMYKYMSLATYMYLVINFRWFEAFAPAIVPGHFSVGTSLTLKPVMVASPTHPEIFMVHTHWMIYASRFPLHCVICRKMKKIYVCTYL